MYPYKSIQSFKQIYLNIIFTKSTHNKFVITILDYKTILEISCNLFIQPYTLWMRCQINLNRSMTFNIVYDLLASRYGQVI